MGFGSIRAQIFSEARNAKSDKDRFGFFHQDLVNHSAPSTTSCGFVLAPTTKSANLPLAIQFWEVGMELGQNQVEALDLWRRVTVTTVRSDAPDLTARQMAVLMTVRLQPAPHTVRGLAATLNVGKPAITRALDTLSRLGFVQRRRDPKDGRNVFVERTEKGDAFLDMLGSTILSGDVIEQRPTLAAVS
jgi:DNA-binding MarR family transcriptional regulator